MADNRLKIGKESIPPWLRYKETGGDGIAIPTVQKSSFDLFGGITKEDLKVGYISTERGYIAGINVCEANSHAKRNPGETFIYKPDRKTVEFLNINQVNRLAEAPELTITDTSCADGIDMNAEPAPVSARFMGGGGIGAVGNPVISESGRVMALHIVNGGFGYQYPPIVKIHDESGIGAGAVVTVGVGTTYSAVQYYTDKEDFEEYNLCENGYTSGRTKNDGGIDGKISSRRSIYGRRWSPSGKDIGPWIPTDYTVDTDPPFNDVIAEYIKNLNQSGKLWWTTRKEPPLKVTSDGLTTNEVYKVQSWMWGGTTTALTEVPFEIYWSSPHRTKGLGFEFVARDGSHSFRIVDTSGIHDGKRRDVYQVKENVIYDVKPLGTRPGPDFKSKYSDKIIHLAEMGLLAKLGVARFQKDKGKSFDINRTGEGDKIFIDFLDTLDDNDDLQIQAQRGKFTASNERKVVGLRGERTTYDLTYVLATGKTTIEPSFMNTYAISPKPPSNVKGSDFAGKWFSFEWDKEFPYDGEYIFRSARDDDAKLYIDNNFVMDMEHFRGRKALGVVTGKGVKKTVTKGNHTIRIDLWNNPQMGTVIDQQPPPPTTSDITFKITTGSMFANGVRIEGLDIDESKPFTPPGTGKKGQLNISHTRKIVYGKKYKVVFSTKGREGVQGDIKYNNLHPANKKIRVVRGGKRIELIDGHSDDTNFSLTIDSGKGKFSDDGRRLKGNHAIKITASWADNPDIADVAVDSVEIGGKTWRRKRERGSQTHTLDLGSAKPAAIKLRTKEPNIIQMEDFHDNDWTDVIVVASGGQFTDLKGDTAYFSVPHPSKKVGQSTSDSGQTVKVFNTVDYINKANRKLWRTNVFGRGGFLNEYGICPFDTNLLLKDNPYAGTHQIVWPNVNFPISGNYDIEVAVDDTVDINIGDIKINKKGFVGNTNVSTGTLKITRHVKAGRHTITANLYQKPGGSYGFRLPGGKKVNKNEVTFKVTSAADFANKITIPGLFSIGKEYKGSQINKTITKQLEAEKEYDVILNSKQSKNVRVRIKDKGKRLEMEEWKDGDWQDIVCTVNQGEFYGAQINRCKFRVDRTIKGINPMALAIKIESTYTKKKVITPRSWNENPMGVAMTIEAPAPPIPQEPVPKAEGRCPNNPFWTTRFPGAKERWHPVQYQGWGELLNEYGISPLPPYDKHRNPVVDVPFEFHWHSPHRTKGLGYRFTSQDGSHTFTIVDNSKVDNGSRTEHHKVKLNTTYNVKAIGQRADAQGTKISKHGHLGAAGMGAFDNSKVIELAEQGLLTKLSAGRDVKEWATNKLDANRRGTGNKIFADFLDTLDDSDDIQIEAGAGQFTASNPRMVHALTKKRKTYDLTYRISKVPANDAGNFTNTWTKSFDFGGYYKAQMEVDDIGELWIDDQKVLDLDRRKDKTYGEKLVWIDGPTSDEEYRATGAVNHDIKVVVENFKSERMKTINAKVFSTLDWVGGGARKSEKKIVRFKITSGSMFANSIIIPELGIKESKPFTPVHDAQGRPMGQRGQIKVTREKEVEVNKVYDVEFYSSGKGAQNNYGIKYVGGPKRPIRVRRNNKRLEFDDNPSNGFDLNAAFTIDRGNVKFSDDGNSLIIKGKEATFTLDWDDDPDDSGRALKSIQIGDKKWRITSKEKGSVTKTVKFARNTDNTANIKLRNKGESVVQMEDHTDNDWTDIQCAASEGRFFDFNGNRCKYVVGSATRVSGGVSGSTTRDGVTYVGPHLFHYTDSRWNRLMNREGVSPIASPTQSLSDPNLNILGWKTLTWKNVHFPKTGKYQVNFLADNKAKLFIDDKEHLLAPDNYNIPNPPKTVDIEVGKGNHDIRVEVFNANGDYRENHQPSDLVFLQNPTGIALRIYTKMTVGTGTYKSWRDNPIGASARLIPPPCPKPSKGKGVVCCPSVTDGGNRYPTTGGGDYTVKLKMLPPTIINEGTNYDCTKDKIRLEPSNGVTLSLCDCAPFGKIRKVCMDIADPGSGNGFFTEPPEVIIDSPTGVNLQIALQFEPVIVPFDIPDIIQVTDLVGLKKTGYYKGKPYYGAVFYENGVKYSGWYKTAGEMIQVYDTMQESIDALVTTPASAIQRQGSDPSGNDPRLNIPNTPENLS